VGTWFQSEESKRRISEALQGRQVSEETRRFLSEATTQTRAEKYWYSGGMTGKHHSEETRRALSATARRNLTGGEDGEAYATVLCPAGFIREVIVILSPGRSNLAVCDFAHPDAKVDIELDGVGHYGTAESDRIRDSKLRGLGWKVIRIRS
jgi:hypothetical protein